MNKKLLMVPIAAMMSLTLAGCGMNNNHAADNERNRNHFQQVGYYTNEDHRGQGGNARILDTRDNDGPVTEMMDNTFGIEDEYRRKAKKDTLNQQNNHNRTNVTNRGRSGMSARQINAVRGEGPFSRADYNYHGHVGVNNNRHDPNSYYYKEYDGSLVDTINRAVSNLPNVRDAQTVVHDQNIVVAALIERTNRTNHNDTVMAIQHTVQPFAKHRNIKIVTDESTFHRLSTINNDMKMAGPKDQVHLDLENLFPNHEWR